MKMNSTTRSAPWYKEITPYQWRALFAATLGWVLDSMDVYLFIIAMPLLLHHFGMTRGMGGFLGSLTLIASAIGGIAFGWIADRFGRTKSMIASILIYSVFTAACGFAQTIAELAVFRFLLGLGVGGEWSTGAALISETWPAKHPWESVWDDAEWVCGRIRARCRGGCCGPAALGLARGLLRRNSARSRHAMASEACRGP